MSLKEARQAIIWSEAEENIKNKTSLEVLVKDANKGGLIMEWQGIQGFLPASQLKADHYPRVDDSDKDKKYWLNLENCSDRNFRFPSSTPPKEGKLIFSEIGMAKKDKEEIISKYNVGDEVSGTITGIVDFGIFLKIEEGVGRACPHFRNRLGAG